MLNCWPCTSKAACPNLFLFKSLYTHSCNVLLHSSHSSVYHFTAMLFFMPPCQSVDVQHYLLFILSEYSQHKVYCILNGHVEIQSVAGNAIPMPGWVARQFFAGHFRIRPSVAPPLQPSPAEVRLHCVLDKGCWLEPQESPERDRYLERWRPEAPAWPHAG